MFEWKHPNYYKKMKKDFLKEAKKWKNLGAQIIGGCCGTSVEHIRVLEDI